MSRTRATRSTARVQHFEDPRPRGAGRGRLHAGGLLVALFVSALGTDFLRGSAMAKVVGIGSDLGALALFGALGHVLWLLAA
ncbi:hypothetical protein [Isoptericola sp. NPDC056134]|uniref:hypothetical protein n=1 Tax=Isoptericola sp. NPDC056134 TaxID=3345723 RepID=UPI0035E55668